MDRPRIYLIKIDAYVDFGRSDDQDDVLQLLSTSITLLFIFLFFLEKYRPDRPIVPQAIQLTRITLKNAGRSRQIKPSKTVQHRPRRNIFLIISFTRLVTGFRHGVTTRMWTGDR
jgi:hypothetical protein